jgi:hypothetical protein
MLVFKSNASFFMLCTFLVANNIQIFRLIADVNLLITGTFWWDMKYATKRSHL